MTHPEVFRSSSELTTLSTDTTFDQLLEKLIVAKIPVEEYGIGNAKTVHSTSSRKYAKVNHS